MNILISNDDGVNAEGIKALAVELSKKHNVVVCAPNREYSGTSHSISFFRPLSFEKFDYPNNIEAYSIDGSPSDSVKFGLSVVCKDKKIDLVVSGINNVLNIGTDIFYSGTTNAALEGTMCGYRSIAVSTRVKKGEFDYLNESKDGKYGFPAEFVAKHIEELAKYATLENAINVNIPCVEREEIKGLKVCKVGRRRYDNTYKKETTEDGREIYHLIGRPCKDGDLSKECDVVYAENGYITITPLTLFPTDFDTLEKIDEKDFEI